MNILYGLAEPGRGRDPARRPARHDPQPIGRHRPRDQHGAPALHARPGPHRSPRTSCSATSRWRTRSSSTGRDAHDRIRKLGDQFGFEIDPDAKVGSLSVGWQQRVEILKALYRSATHPRPRRADRGAHSTGDARDLRCPPAARPRTSAPRSSSSATSCTRSSRSQTASRSSGAGRSSARASRPRRTRRTSPS